MSSWAAKCCPGFCHVRVFTYLSVANPKTRKTITDMAKIAIKSEKLTPFGGIFPFINIFIQNSLFVFAPITIER